jgi:cytochrome d ubiquinol oxidase subunit I
MDAVLLARVQFALTVGFHYIFPPLTIGLAWLIVVIQTLHLKTGRGIYRSMARFWVRLFAVSFAVGVATGIVMEFQFGTNWASYSRFVGDIFGAPLAAEAVFSFFLESTFLGLLLFGEKRLSAFMHWFSGLMVAVGATLSAFWIIVANSWQHTPAGYHIVDGRAELTDFWAAVFNPSTLPRFSHVMSGAFVTGAFFMMGVSAYYLLRDRHVELARRSLRIGLVVGVVSSLAQLGTGHLQAVQVFERQPVKLAAIDAHFETADHAPYIVFGIPDEEQERVRAKVEVPWLLSLLVGLDPATEVKGLRDFPREHWPPVATTFFSFKIMETLGFMFIAVTLLAAGLTLTGRLMRHRWLLWVLLVSIPLPIAANEFGWIATEVGRQPWVVQGELLTRDAVSVSVPAAHILASILMFSSIYVVLGTVWIVLLRFKILKGPEPTDGGDE